MEYLDEVDENDEVVGKFPYPKGGNYDEVPTHRIAHILVFDDRERMLLQMRSKTKFFCPNHWVTSAGGHVSSGEDYKQGALRELEEELGIKSELEFISKDLYEYREGSKKFLATFKN